MTGLHLHAFWVPDGNIHVFDLWVPSGEHAPLPDMDFWACCCHVPGNEGSGRANSDCSDVDIRHPELFLDNSSYLVS